MLVAWARECADHSAHFSIKHRHKRAIALICRDPLHSRVHLRSRGFVPEFAHQHCERRSITHVSGADRKIKPLFVRQDGTRPRGGMNADICNYVEIALDAPPLIPTKPSRSKCKMISCAASSGDNSPVSIVTSASVGSS